MEDAEAQLNAAEPGIIEVLGRQPQRFVSRHDPKKLSRYLAPEDLIKIRKLLNHPPAGWQSGYKLWHILDRQSSGIKPQDLKESLERLEAKIPGKIRRYTRNNNLHCDPSFADEILKCKTRGDLKKLTEQYLLQPPVSVTG
jgi:hypothetical protein